MRTRMLAIAFTALAVSPALLADQQAPTDHFDFAKINATIKSAMQPVVSESQDFRKFTYKIDAAQTDIENDRYAVQMSVKGKAPWESKDFTATARLILDHDAQGKRGIIKLDADMDITTDTLALIRHHADSLVICERASQSTGLMRLLLTEKCKAAPRLAKVQSFDELQLILREHLDSSQTALSVYHDDLQQALSVVTGGVAKGSLALQIKETEDLLQSVGAAQVQRTQEGIQLSISNINLMGIISGVNVEATITPTNLHIKKSGTTNFGSAIFLAAKPELLQIMRDLESGEAYTKPVIQMETRFWMRLIEDHISGHSL